MTDPARSGVPALLLILLDSRAPTGSSNHSAGLEAAVEAGWVNDLDDVAAFCTARLRTSGRVAAGFAAAAALDPGGWRELDAEFDARTASEAMRAASRALGAGLRRLLRATLVTGAAGITELTELTEPDFVHWDTQWGPVAPHHPIVVGTAARLAGATAVDAARAAALAVVTTPASAAVRLLGLDPFAVHAVLAGLTPEIDALATTFGAPEADPVTARQNRELPADCLIALDLLADVHVHQEVRLFAS